MAYDTQDSQFEEDSGPIGNMDRLALQKVAVTSVVSARRAKEFGIYPGKSGYSGKNEHAGYAATRRLEKHGDLSTFHALKRNGGLLEHDIREAIDIVTYEGDEVPPEGEEPKFQYNGLDREVLAEARRSGVSLADALDIVAIAELSHLESKLRGREYVINEELLEDGKERMERELAGLHEGSGILYVEKLEEMLPEDFIRAGCWIVDNYSRLEEHGYWRVSSYLSNFGQFTSADKFIRVMYSFIEPAITNAFAVSYEPVENVMGDLVDADLPKLFENDDRWQRGVLPDHDAEAADDADLREANGIVEFSPDDQLGMKWEFGFHPQDIELEGRSSKERPELSESPHEQPF